MRRSVELDSYFSVLPAFRVYKNLDYNYKSLKSRSVSSIYNSQTQPKLSIQKLENAFTGVLDIAQNFSTSRYWPGDKEKVSK